MKQWIRIALLALGLALVAMPASAASGQDEVTALFDRAQTGDPAALARLKEMAEQGNARAQNNLGVMYAKGRGVAQDDAQAMAWYRKAAAQGLAKAQVNLGDMYGQGRGVAQDDAQAVAWYRKAADQGHARAQFALGWMYWKGRGVAQDDAQAVAWFRKAAAQGDADAQSTLGASYANGRGVAQDDAQAVAWFRKAADQGHADAQFNLGLMYTNGRGVAQDDAQAVAWYRKAAAQGLAKAQTNLDELIRQGRGQATAVAQQTPPPPAPVTIPVAAPAPDTTPPVITLTQGARMVLNQAQATLSGAVRDGSRVAELSLDGRALPIGADGRFSVQQFFPVGETRLTFKAVDAYGNVATETLTVERRAAATQAVASDDPELRLPLRTVPPNPNALALIVGIEDYESAPQAQHAQRDAELFYDYAQRTLGVPEQNIKLLTGKEADRKGLLKAVKTWLVPMVRKDRSQVVVYFAGHGLASSDGERSFLIPQDGAPELLEDTALDRQQIFDAIAKADPKSTLLFFDTCYSGGARGGAGTLVASSRAIILKPRTAPLPPGFVQFSAAGNAQLAISHPQQPHGLFSYYLMRGLSGEADANRDKRLTAGELHDFVEERVQRTAQSQGRPQVPEILGDRDRVIAEWR